MRQISKYQSTVDICKLIATQLDLQKELIEEKELILEFALSPRIAGFQNCASELLDIFRFVFAAMVSHSQKGGTLQVTNIYQLPYSELQLTLCSPLNIEKAQSEISRIIKLIKLPIQLSCRSYATKWDGVRFAVTIPPQNLLMNSVEVVRALQNELYDDNLPADLKKRFDEEFAVSLDVS